MTFILLIDDTQTGAFWDCMWHCEYKHHTDYYYFLNFWAFPQLQLRFMECRSLIGKRLLLSISFISYIFEKLAAKSTWHCRMLFQLFSASWWRTPSTALPYWRFVAQYSYLLPSSMPYGPQSSKAEWTSSSIVLSQVARGRPTGLLQSVGGLRAAAMTRWWSSSGAERARCPPDCLVGSVPGVWNSQNFPQTPGLVQCTVSESLKENTQRSKRLHSQLLAWSSRSDTVSETMLSMSVALTESSSPVARR